jgi:hypothetical protein
MDRARPIGDAPQRGIQDIRDLLHEPLAHERDGLALYNALLDRVTSRSATEPAESGSIASPDRCDCPSGWR